MSAIHRSVVVAALLVPMKAWVCADSVELSGGGQVVGQAVKREKVTIVALDDDYQIAIDNTRVRRIFDAAEYTEYRKLADKAGDDAERHYALSRWCSVSGNVPGLSIYFKRFHLQRTIELDPNHSKARSALRYRKERGRWVKVAELFHERGMVRHGGKWELPEAITHQAHQDEYDNAVKRWNREIKKMVTVIRRGRSGKRYDETVEKLTAIDDPRAAVAVSDQLTSSRGKPGGMPTQPRELRRLWVKLLGRFRNSQSVATLVREGIEEPDQDIRERALEELRHSGWRSAIASYRAVLTKNSSSELINRAARALSWFPDRELALDVVQALVTQHTKKDPSGPQYQVGFGDQGGTNTFGNSKKVITITKQNPAVLALVKQIIPEQDFGYDEQRWMEYLSQEKTRYSGDLRRDP